MCVILVIISVCSNILFYMKQEVHIIHTFPSDFYGIELRVIVLGFIRPEKDYSSVDALIKDIHIDIEAAKRSLQREAYLTFKDNDFFEK